MLRRRRKDTPLPPFPPMPLDEAVRGVAACPCIRHQAAFVAALEAAEELVVRLTGDPVLAPGGEVLTVGTALNEDRSFLHVFTDESAARAAFPDGAFRALPAQSVYRMALTGGNEGLLVTAGGDDAWAAVTADGVTRLLEGPTGSE
jgi:hypothetical protein